MNVFFKLKGYRMSRVIGTNSGHVIADEHFKVSAKLFAFMERHPVSPSGPAVANRTCRA